MTCVLFHASQLMAPPRDPTTMSKLNNSGKKDTAGKGWFDLPAQVREETGPAAACVHPSDFLFCSPTISNRQTLVDHGCWQRKNKRTAGKGWFNLPAAFLFRGASPSL